MNLELIQATPPIDLTPVAFAFNGNFNGNYNSGWNSCRQNSCAPEPAAVVPLPDTLGLLAGALLVALVLGRLGRAAAA